MRPEGAVRNASEEQGVVSRGRKGKQGLT